MTIERTLELLPFDDQVRSLRSFLHLYRSRQRPFLALFAIKNHLLHEAGLNANNRPTVRWYQDRLMKAGVTGSRWIVQYQLDQLAKFGVLDVCKKIPKVVEDRRNLDSLIKAEVKEYSLNVVIYPVLEQALKQLLGVDAFDGLTRSGRP